MRRTVSHAACTEVAEVVPQPSGSFQHHVAIQAEGVAISRLELNRVGGAVVVAAEGATVEVVAVEEQPIPRLADGDSRVSPPPFRGGSGLRWP